jgi:hypothetical protein
MRGGYAFTQRALRSDGAVGPSSSFLKSGGGVEALKSAREGGPISLVANARAALGHLGLRNGYSLGVRRPSNHTSDWVVIQSVAEE